MFDNQAYIVQMDKRFCTEENPVTGEKYLAIRTPVFGPQQVLSIKYLKVNDNTRIGLIAYYSAGAGRLHSYVSLWDGRLGVFLACEVGEDSYYVPRYGCFALSCGDAANARCSEKPNNFKYIFSGPEDDWVGDTIELFNNYAQDAQIVFSNEDGLCVNYSDNLLPLDEIGLTRTNKLFARSGAQKFYAKLRPAELGFVGRVKKKTF